MTHSDLERQKKNVEVRGDVDLLVVKRTQKEFSVGRVKECFGGGFTVVDEHLHRLK